MPINKFKGETKNQCVSRAMHENTKTYPQKQAIAISISQCNKKKSKGNDKCPCKIKNQ